MRPRLLILDEPTEGIQPSIIKDIERAIRTLVAAGDIAILLVEQYYDFAKSLADHYVVLSRGEVVARGAGATMERTTFARISPSRYSMPQFVRRIAVGGALRSMLITNVVVYRRCRDEQNVPRAAQPPDAARSWAMQQKMGLQQVGRTRAGAARRARSKPG